MHKFSAKSIRSKLSLSFITVTCTVLLIFTVTYPLILKMFANELEKNTTERMQNALLRLDDNLSSIQQQIFSLNNSFEFKSIFSQNEESEYAKLVLWNKATQTLRELKYVEAYSLILRGDDNIITGNGIYSFDRYFETYWNNPDYNSNFWKKELYQPFYTRYYPQGTYTSYAFGESESEKTVVPIAFKNYFDNRYMIIAFVDIQSMCRDIDPYILENLSVYYNKAPLIPNEANPVMDYEEYLSGRTLAVKTTGDSYSVICRSGFNDFIYVKSTPIREVRSGLNKIYLLCLSIVIATLFISTAVIFIMTRKLTKPFTSIMETLKANHVTNEKNLNEFSFIEDNFHNLFDSNQQIAKELKEKNVMLSGFLYQSKLKNIYMNIQNDSWDGGSLELSYYLLSFQVIYREHVSDLIHKTYSEISFILKDHLEQVLKRYFPSLLLFQPEENSFFAKIGLSTREHSMDQVMEQVKKQLEIEEEYCYFFIAVSSCIEDETLITNDYYGLLELQQQFCLKESSQLIWKDQLQNESNLVSLSGQQTEDLKKLALAGDCDGTMKLISNLLDAGLTPKTSRLRATLFCNAIINVLLQALSERFISLPTELPVQELYNRISRCYSEHAFCKSVLDFSEQVLDYITKNSTAEDPMIAGVKRYVADNYSSEFTMEMMSESLKISKSYLSTYFKSRTGLNLLDFIQQYRVQKAIELMKGSNIKLSDIGSRVGILNPNSFIRVFKKHTGVTPSEYRKNLNT